MRSYKHLNLPEREKLFGFLKEGFSQREVARKLGRDQGSVSRELERNKRYGRKYLPCYAQKRAERVGIKQRYQAPLKEPLVFLYVREKLRLGWSPEIISGRLPIDHPGYSIHQETIYRYIYSTKKRTEKFYQYLPLARKRRMKKNGRSVKRNGTIPGAVSIDLRPKTVLRRRVLGHWETDNMEGVRGDKTAVSVTTERLARKIVLSKLKNRRAETKAELLVKRLSVLPKEALLTLTSDNGKENSNHLQISQTLNISFFFCHAYRSWEKGSVENRVKAVRRFVPKGTSIDLIPEEYIQGVEDNLNNRPMKCLRYLTPNEKFSTLLPACSIN